MCTPRGSVLEYLESTVRRLPDKTAFSDTQTSVCFGELYARARGVGTALLAGGLPKNAPVAVFLGKSCGAVAAMLGAVYAGGFYSLLDPALPAARLRAVLETLCPAALITDADGAAKAAALGTGCPLYFIESLQNTEPDACALSARRALHADLDALYCSFTSGSTGVPKGVAVSHRSVIGFIEVFTPLFGIGESDVLANQAPLDFDVSVKDIYPALKTGAQVVLIPKRYFTFLPKLMDLLCDAGVTTLTWSVSALCLISAMKGLEYRLPARVRRVLFSGEVMPPDQLAYWRRHYPDALFVNLYGPTEITCNCTYHIVERAYDAHERIPIGLPFPNARVFLLDENDRRIDAPHTPGELCVGGTPVALGYYNDPLRTAASFVQNPLNNAYFDRIYRTGDVCEYGADGLLYYVGRRDAQVKHRGRRVELGEIEAALCALPGVTRACAVYLEDRQCILAAYSGDAQNGALVRALKDRLPDYMVPGAFLRLDALPLTPHGKLDRAAVKRAYTES